jgi:hypothetical protein
MNLNPTFSAGPGTALIGGLIPSEDLLLTTADTESWRLSPSGGYLGRLYTGRLERATLQILHFLTAQQLLHGARRSICVLVRSPTQNRVDRMGSGLRLAGPGMDARALGPPGTGIADFDL